MFEFHKVFCCFLIIISNCCSFSWKSVYAPKNGYQIVDDFELQADANADVRGRMINAGIMIIDKHGRDNVSLLFPIFENYLNKKVSICLSYKCI